MSGHTRSLLGLAAALLLAHQPLLAEPQGKLIFVSNRDGNAQIYSMQADGSEPRALTQGAEENTEPAWSPDGRHIAFTSYRDGNAEIYVMDADGRNQRRLTREALADNSPRWTPDGRLLFRSTRDRWANFYLMNADGSGLKQLTASESDKGEPVLSPDGKWIAFVAHADRGSTDIQLVSIAGGPVSNLTAALSKNGKSYPSWSPDSQRLMYVESGGGGLNIKVIGRDGSLPGALTDTKHTNAFPVWSPDGKRIAFASGRAGSRLETARADIHVMNADGSHVVNLTQHPDEDNYPVWSTDSRTLYFVSLRDGTAQIYAVDASGGQARRLTNSSGHDLTIRPQPVSASARALAASTSADLATSH